MKKIFSTFLSLLLTLLFLCACAPTEQRQPLPGSDFSGEEQPQTGVFLNEVPLAEYTLVYGKDNLYGKFSAALLREALKDSCGVTLDIFPDNRKTKEHEILLGDTSRITTEKDTAVGFGKEEFCVEAEGSKILLIASGYMVGGAVREFAEQCAATPSAADRRDITVAEEGQKKTYQYKEAKNVLLYIGDGMGPNHIEWAKKEGMTAFYAEDMPNQGFAQTYSADSSITDSAAAATALATGYKTQNGYVGCTGKVKKLKNLRELAWESGAKTGVVTTDLATGATPGGFTVHVNSRKMTSEIETQQKALLDSGKIDILKGDVGDQLLTVSRSSLSELAEGDSFFFMLEEGYIDIESHNNEKEKMLHAMNRFNETVAYAIQFTLVRGDVLFIVTSDHETGGVTPSGDTYQFTEEDHTGVDVRVFAMGSGAEFFHQKTVNNVQIPSRLAKVYANATFGDPELVNNPQA